MLAWVKSELNGVHSQIYLEEVLSVWSPSNIQTGKLVCIYEILCSSCWVLRYVLRVLYIKLAFHFCLVP